MAYLIAANWKMNKTVAESIDYIKTFKELVRDLKDVDIMIAPSFTALSSVSSLISDTNINLGAQNMFYAEKGAYTGEISPIMLKELNVKYVILGHSERRHIFGEKDELINKKVHAAIEFGLRPILCVGETLEERELGKTKSVVERQIRSGIAGLEKEVSSIDIAYEPVWAIGTGVNATVEQAQEVHQFIRNLIHDISKGNDKGTRILYGGSVNEKNASELIKAKDVEGFLVGTASLDPKKFYEIILKSMEV
ncbi:MAG: triose-phosphate isomerase [Sulfurihydrogenibium sp.]|jgi:triosephosphate isomerase|uniref:triose-phosphate isomerase n=1 Tax=Sulfurihydrogenibium sp. TaxID=2053621 RepID=UPI000CC6C4CB|nr:MAG: triose-phosphate isomerase [Sulfurihydrogenibium sp.]